LEKKLTKNRRREEPGGSLGGKGGVEWGKKNQKTAKAGKRTDKGPRKT